MTPVIKTPDHPIVFVFGASNVPRIPAEVLAFPTVLRVYTQRDIPADSDHFAFMLRNLYDCKYYLLVESNNPGNGVIKALAEFRGVLPLVEAAKAIKIVAPFVQKKETAETQPERSDAIVAEAGTDIPVAPFAESTQPASGEVRITDPATGGQKGTKLARYSLIPTQPLWELAELYGKGAMKYAPRNWERGYAWSLSFDAAMRHLSLFWSGEDRDPETKAKHVINAAWHCLALAQFMDDFRVKDDRPNTVHSVD